MNTGGAVPHIDIIMPKEYCSFSSKVVGIEQKTDNELIQILEGVNVQLSGDESGNLIELVHRNTANNLLDLLRGSLFDAVREFGMALTRGICATCRFSRSGSSSMVKEGHFGKLSTVLSTEITVLELHVTA